MKQRTVNLLAIASLLCAAPNAQAQRVTQPSARARTESIAQRDPNGPTPTQEERVQEHLQKALAHPGTPEGLVELLRMDDSRPWVAPWLLADRFHAFAQSPNQPPLRRAMATYLEARMRARYGQRREAEALANSLGFITQWWVLGALENDGRRGFALESDAEAARYRALDPSQNYPGKERPVRWRLLPELHQLGSVVMGASIRPVSGVCALAHSTVLNPLSRPQNVELWFGSAGQSVVFVNGQEVMRDDVARALSFMDRRGAAVTLRPGRNRVLVKVCVDTESPEFLLRFTRPGGAPLLLASDADPAAAPVLQPPAVTPPVPPALGELASLEAAVTAESVAPETLEFLGELLRGTGADPTSEDRGADLVRRAAERAPMVHRWMLYAGYARERNNRLYAIERALALAPDSPLVLTALAHERRTSVRPESAMPLIDRVLARYPQEVLARVERALLLDSNGLSLAALAELERASHTAPYSTGVLELQIAVADRAQQADRVAELRRRLLLIKQDDVALHRELAGDARVRGDRTEVRARVDAMIQAAPWDPASYSVGAQFLEAAGAADNALGVLARALELAPEDAGLWRTKGELEIRIGQRDQARTSMRRALSLRPQDRTLRQHIESLEPTEPRPDEQLAESSEVFLRRRTDPATERGPAEYRARSLNELTVRTVYPNGLAGTFRQSVFEVLNAEGAQQYRQIPVGFEPDTQRFELRSARVYHRDGSVDESSGLDEYTVSGGASRMYYDSREMVISFARLRPGDVVEVRWRVDDVAQRNAFSDYFGDLEIFQGEIPRANVRYVLRAPPSRRFYFHAPELRGLRRSEREESGSKVYDFIASDVPAVAPEDNAPGVTERAAYLHVSTYQTWEEVARWYWGLIRDQLRADDRVREIALRAVRGITEPREKVRAIYNWVITNTRYVALEFGIHGFKPYRVADVCSRGFGDCKDKASTIVTMLREVGIDASIVLVRTRRNGNIDTAPASLAVFDHAIAYVPPMPGLPDGIFLDGTAGSSAMEELPSMDQGAMGLIVNQRGEGRLTHLPFVAAQSNTVEIHSELELTANGGARLRVTQDLRGPDAGSLRSAMEAEATRSERVQRWLSGSYPGVRVNAVRTGVLTRVDVPAHLEYDAEIPSIGTRQDDLLRFAPTSQVQMTSEFAERSTRVSDVMLPGPLTTTDHRTIRIPAGASVVDLPPTANIRSAWVSLAYSTAHAGNTITLQRTLTYHVDRVAVGDYAAFRAVCQQIDEALSRRVAVRLNGRAP
jgi:transglutaminase-like putative cysteine protease/tetratricopeptide (TPR) repeat protein